MRHQTIEESRLGYHIILGPRDGGVITATPQAHRIIARAIHDACKDASLLAFGEADTHLHLLLANQRPRVGRTVRRLALMLNWRLGVTGGFKPSHFKPISDAHHLISTFRYVLRQPSRHGLDPYDDPWSEGSSLVDLLNLRPLGAHVLRAVRQAFPRLGRQEILNLAGIKDLHLQGLPLEDIGEAAKAAALITSLDGSTVELMAVKHAIVEIVGHRLETKDTASIAHLAGSTVRRLRHHPAHPGLVEAIRGQLALHEARYPKENVSRTKLPRQQIL